jgi:hypothetical protein
MSPFEDEVRSLRWNAMLVWETGGVAGQVVRFDGDAIELAFPTRGAPLLAIAQVVLLRLSANDSDDQVDVPAFVVARTDDQTHRTYELQPRQKDALAELSRRHRRAGVRIRPRNDAPMGVELRDHAGAVLARGRALDVSVKGLGMLLEQSDELSLKAHVRLTVKLKISREPARTLSAHVRSRRLVGTLIRIGLEFEPERTAEYADAEKWLTAYVAKRQQEMAVGDDGPITPPAI